MALTDPQEKEILQYLFGRIPFVPPPIWYVGLSSTEINEDGTGATQPIGNYTQIAVPNSPVGFTFTGGQIISGTQIAFPTANVSWGPQNYMFFSDMPIISGGTIRFRGSLSPAQTIDQNQKLFFDPGDFVATLL